MQLHRLTFCGIGPFPTEQAIDFGRLGEAGLFLMEGPTGAGKSTIIDALVYALYNSVAAESGDNGRLVSHFLDPAAGVRPFVELVFETDAGIFRIRRTPEYQRPARRGTGLTTEKSSVTMVRLATADAVDGEPISTRAGEVDVEVHRALGLSKEQFIRTIVLPQGEFAAFLSAEGKDRQPLLQRIFRTEDFEKLQKALAERAKDAERAVERARQALVTRISNLGTAAGIDDADLPDAHETTTVIDAAVATTGTRLADAEAAATELEEQSRAAARVAGEALIALDARIALRDRKRSALALQADVTAAEPASRADVDRRDAAHRAARVADVLTRRRSAEQDVTRADTAVERAKTQVDPDLADLDQDALAAKRAATDELRGSLKPIADLERGLAGRERTLAERRNDLATAVGRREELDTRRAELPAEITAARARLDAATALAATADGLAAEVARAKRQHEAAVALVAASVSLAERTGAGLTAAQAWATADVAAIAARTAYREGIAAELGASLTPDAPCPVCGSCDHPAVAQPAEDHVTKAAVERAERLARDAERKRQQADVDREKAARAVTSLEAAADGLTEAQAAAALGDVTARHRTARTAAGTLPTLRADVDRLETELNGLDANIAEVQKRITSLTTLVHTEGDALTADRATVVEEAGGFADVRARMAALAVRSSAISDLEAALTARDGAVTQLTAARADEAAALAREGFADAAAADAAGLTKTALAAVESRIAQHAKRAAEAEGLLAQPDLQGVDADEALDRRPAAALAAEANATAEQAAADRVRVETARAAAQTAAAAVLDAAAERDRAEAEAAPVRRVARIVNGTNPANMPLATWVLLRRFDAVVAAANDHLRVMSDGHYELVPEDHDPDGRRKSGLGLKVLDLRTEQERGPKSLSGGEKFYTSLALALGLADTVTAESGGIQLGTLFVDEGFGSLDLATLDDVLRVLTGLHTSGGRVVGVVSHVEEMKSQISERIEVRRLADQGPSTLRVVA